MQRKRAAVASSPHKKVRLLSALAINFPCNELVHCYAKRKGDGYSIHVIGDERRQDVLELYQINTFTSVMTGLLNIR